MNDLGNGLKVIFCGFILAIIMFISILFYSGYKFFSDTVIKSKVLVKPDYILTTNGKQIDTIYVYKFK